MPGTRRSLIQTVAIAGVMSSRLTPALAQAGATPEATPDLDPEQILELLRTSPITSPLFPSDYGTLEILPWVDDSDKDLIGTVGAFLVQDTSQADAGSEAGLIGAYIVHPDAASAEESVAETGSDGRTTDTFTLFGDTGAWQQDSSGYSLVVITKGPVIVSAFGMPQTLLGPDETATDFRESDARAIGNLAGLLDHLRLVTTKQ
jgi:hypothetical protein